MESNGAYGADLSVTGENNIVTNSEILSNTDAGIRNEGDGSVDATGNWWGSPDGPGEDVCVGNVDCSDSLGQEPSGVSIDIPDTVSPDGDFEVTIETGQFATAAIEVSSSAFNASLSLVDSDGDPTPTITDNRIEFVDTDASQSTYVVSVDVIGGSEGDTGTLTAYAGGEANQNNNDESATSTFSVSDSLSSPVDGVSDQLWTEVTGDGTLTLGDLGTAIQEYQDSGQVNGVDISLGDLGSLIQEYQS